MKNLLLSFAFILVGSVAFANETNTLNEAKKLTSANETEKEFECTVTATQVIDGRTYTSTCTRTSCSGAAACAESKNRDKAKLVDL